MKRIIKKPLKKVPVPFNRHRPPVVMIRASAETIGLFACFFGAVIPFVGPPAKKKG